MMFKNVKFSLEHEIGQPTESIGLKLAPEVNLNDEFEV